MARTEKVKADAHQIVTDAVIAYLEAFEKGELDSKWVRPWEKLLTDSHYCAATGEAYKGIVNMFALSVLSWKRGFKSLAWGTFKQWKELGTEEKPVGVRKGAKACYIFVPLLFTKKDGSGNPMVDSDGNELKGLSFKQVPVFNADEVDGWTEPMPEMPVSKVMEDSKIDKFIASLGMDLSFGGNRAYYSPVGDHVRMPPKEAFKDTKTSTATEAYYGTLLHETVHWTGHKSRCNRAVANMFGTEAYAEEELVAEMGATILCCKFAVSESPRADHAQYIASWLKSLKNDKRIIFKACGQAQKAIRWMEDQQPTKG